MIKIEIKGEMSIIIADIDATNEWKSKILVLGNI
jgi:hypothetical protein